MSVLKISEFSFMLKTFNDLIKDSPTAKSVEKDLTELKDVAVASAELNLRQKEAVMARCDSYMDGSYGKKDNEFKAHKQS